MTTPSNHELEAVPLVHEVKPKLTVPSVANLRRASQAVYLACDSLVADDISNLLRWGADRAEELEELKDMILHDGIEKWNLKT